MKSDCTTDKIIELILHHADGTVGKGEYLYFHKEDYSNIRELTTDIRHLIMKAHIIDLDGYEG